MGFQWIELIPIFNDILCLSYNFGIVALKRDFCEVYECIIKLAFFVKLQILAHLTSSFTIECFLMKSKLVVYFNEILEQHKNGYIFLFATIKTFIFVLSISNSLRNVQF